MTIALVSLFVLIVLFLSIPTDQDEGVDLGVLVGNVSDEGRRE